VKIYDVLWCGGSAVHELAEGFIDTNRIPLGLAEGDPRRDELVARLASRLARAIDWFVEEVWASQAGPIFSTPSVETPAAAPAEEP